MIQVFELNHKLEGQSHIPHWVQFHKNENYQFIKWTFKSMKLIKFNMIIMNNWWFNFTMDWHRIQYWLEKRIAIRWRHQSNYWTRKWNWIIKLRFRILFMLKFNFKKKITCQNINMVLKILMLVKFNGRAEIESWFPK